MKKVLCSAQKFVVAPSNFPFLLLCKRDEKLEKKKKFKIERDSHAI